MAALIKTPDDPIVQRVRPQQLPAGPELSQRNRARSPDQANGQRSRDHIHELNQPLTAAANYINAARRWMTLPDGSRKAAPLLDKAAEQMSRAGNLIQHLRGLAEIREADLCRDNGNDMTRETLTSRIRDANLDR